LYILGVVGYVTPIWDVLAPKGEWEEAAEHIYGPILINFFPIRQAVPGGLAQAQFCSWARWARLFIEKKVYCSKYSPFTYNPVFIRKRPPSSGLFLMFSKYMGTREWMDGIGLMTTSQLGKCSQFGARFWCWARWARFFIEKFVYYSRYNTLHPFLWLQRGAHRWMALDVHFGPPLRS